MTTVPSSNTGRPEVPERLHALDAVRAGALLLGVAYHAANSYLPTRMALVQDGASPSLLVFSLVSHSFRMTLFFLIAGLFARMMIVRRGEGEFLRNRASRIFLPLVVFCGPAALAISLIARWSVSVDPAAISLGWPQLGLRTVPLSHLWFLYYLCLLYAGALGARAAARLVDRQGRLARALDAALLRLVSWRAAALVAAVPMALLLDCRKFLVVTDGLPAPDHGLAPHLTPLTSYAAAFAFGWFLQRQPALFALLRRQGALHLLVAAGLSSVLFLPALWGAPPKLTPPILGTGLYALADWCWTLGLLGFALRFLAAERPGLRYVADASYWIYLLHLPLTLAFQALLFPLNWPPMVKWAAVLGGTLAVAIASYHLLVRYTWLGAWLNGRRHRRAESERPSRLAANA